MDRETVRMLLLVLGVLAVASVYVWGRYKSRVLDFLNRRGEFDELDYDEDETTREAVEGGPEDDALHGLSFSAREPEPAILPLDGDDDDELEAVAPAKPPAASQHMPDPARNSAPLGAPFLIQLSVVAADDGFFNGEDLRDALVELDLIYGDMGIYHRYDREYREPLFSVASLVEPGTFPIEDMESFECPGVVLFFQPPQVSDPLAVFDDLVNTARELAEKLGGVEWDERREALTDDKIDLMRQRLEAAY
jgi:cell division protein ZipA